MLNREICEACYHKFIMCFAKGGDPNVMAPFIQEAKTHFAILWEKETKCKCPISLYDYPIIDKPPEDCPYTLEHLVK